MCGGSVERESHVIIHGFVDNGVSLTMSDVDFLPDFHMQQSTFSVIISYLKAETDLHSRKSSHALSMEEKVLVALAYLSSLELYMHQIVLW